MNGMKPNSNGNGNREAERPLQEREAQPALYLVDSQKAVEEAVRQILCAVGENPDRDGLIDTPQRVAKAYSQLLEGYALDLDAVVNGALFEVEYGAGEMVAMSNIEYHSLCEHHLLPFTGRAHVAYIPRDKVIGLSKIPRIVDMFSKRLQVQERLTSQIAEGIAQATGSADVMVLLEGEHSCASLRGVEKHGVNMVTQARRGEFETDPHLRDEFYRMIGR